MGSSAARAGGARGGGNGCARPGEQGRGLVDSVEKCGLAARGKPAWPWRGKPGRWGDPGLVVADVGGESPA